MHVWLVDGVFTKEVYAIFSFAKGLPADNMITARNVHSYLQDWHWPKQGGHAANVFETGDFQATASQQLNINLVLTFFLMTVATPDDAKAAIASFIAGSLVVELIGAALRGCVGPDTFSDAVFDHLRKHFAVYGEEWWVFKHHMAAHVPGTCMRNAQLKSCALNAIVGNLLFDVCKHNLNII